MEIICTGKRLNGHIIHPNGTSYPPENVIDDFAPAGNPDFSLVSAEAQIYSRLSFNFGEMLSGILYAWRFSRDQVLRKFLK